MPLKVNEDAKVKKKACNTDIEEEITGFNSFPYRMAFPAKCLKFAANQLFGVVAWVKNTIWVRLVCWLLL
jgi:hypothetical protein